MKSRYFILMLLAFSLLFGTFLMTMIFNKPNQLSNLNETDILSLDHLKVINGTYINPKSNSTKGKNMIIRDHDKSKNNAEILITDDFEKNNICEDHANHMISSAACSMLNAIKLMDKHNIKSGGKCEIKDQLNNVDLKFYKNDYLSALNELKCITCLYNKMNTDPEHKGKLSEKCLDQIAQLHQLNSFYVCEKNIHKYNETIKFINERLCCLDLVKGIDHRDLRIKPLNQIFNNVGELCKIAAFEDGDNRLNSGNQTTVKSVTGARREEKETTAISQADND